MVCTATNVNMIDNTDDKMMGTGKFKKKCGSNEKKKRKEKTITGGTAQSLLDLPHAPASSAE